MIRSREIRKRQGMSQRTLAQNAGIEQGSLSEYETGKKNPSLPVLIRIANVLECSLDELVDKDGTLSTAS